jgi:arylsulfatase
MIFPFDPDQAPENYYSTTCHRPTMRLNAWQIIKKSMQASPSFITLLLLLLTSPSMPHKTGIQKYKERYLAGWDEIRKQRFARQKKIGLINTTLSKLEPKVGPPYAFPDAIKKLGLGEIDRPIPWESTIGQTKRIPGNQDGDSCRND